MNEDNSDNDNDNYDDDITVKEINDFKKTDKTKSFEDQIDILKKYHG